MKTIEQVITELNKAIDNHPLICPECGGWKHASEVICEQCRIDITIENTSVL